MAHAPPKDWRTSTSREWESAAFFYFVHQIISTEESDPPRMSDIVPAVATPTERKSWVQSFVERARGEIQSAPPATPISYVREAGSTLGEFAASGAVGSLLGAAHAKWGLDSKGGPIDGWLAGGGAIASVLLSGHMPEIAAYARKLGERSFTVFSFRKGFEAVRHEPLAGGGAGGVTRIAVPGTGPGINGEDPIERVAKGLG